MRAARSTGRGPRSEQRDAAAEQRELRLVERELTEIWGGQRFPPEALRLADGTLLRVVYRGRPGRGPGPDFRDAVVALADGTLLHGDIELHVRASDFRRHGHHADPAYNRLVLHVVFQHDGGATLLENGAEVLVVPLAAWVASRRSELEQWLSTPPLWQEPCRDAVSRLGVEEVRARLSRLGQRRLRQKAEALRRRIRAEGADGALYRELLEACGYGPNRAVFRRLAEGSSWPEVAGDPSGRLQAVAEAMSLCFEKQTRPGAGPDNRLRGAAVLLSRLAAGAEGLATAVRRLVEEADTGADLVTSLVVSEAERTLIGRGRAAELAVNVVLPAALALDSPEGTVYGLYEGLPDPGSYGLTAYLEGILRRQHPGVVKGAAERQGLLLMQKEYCSQGGCGSCPLSPG